MLHHFLLPSPCDCVAVQEMMEKMFEIISITPLEVQHEIITCLPEVVDDGQHGEVTNKLKYKNVHNIMGENRVLWLTS